MIYNDSKDSTENLNNKKNDNKDKDLDLSLRLIQDELSGIYITILGYIILGEAAKEARNAILLNKEGIGSVLNNSARDALLANKIILIGITLLTDVAFSRLKQQENNFNPSDSSLDLSGISDIYTGYAINVIAEAYKVMGSNKIFNSLQDIDIE